MLITTYPRNVLILLNLKIVKMLLDNQSVCSSLGKTISLALSSSQLPVALCVWWRTHGFSMSTLTCLLLSLFSSI